MKSSVPSPRSHDIKVASFAEAWIEIIHVKRNSGLKWSPPSRRRGLKSDLIGGNVQIQRRLLRGGVD